MSTLFCAAMSKAICLSLYFWHLLPYPCPVEFIAFGQKPKKKKKNKFSEWFST
jgi:hypothetical protein